MNTTPPRLRLYDRFTAKGKGVLVPKNLEPQTFDKLTKLKAYVRLMKPHQLIEVSNITQYLNENYIEKGDTGWADKVGTIPVRPPFSTVWVEYTDPTANPDHYQTGGLVFMRDNELHVWGFSYVLGSDREAPSFIGACFGTLKDNGSLDESTLRYYPDMYLEPTGDEKEVQEIEKNITDDLSSLAILYYVCVFAFGLCHCKNVKIVETTEQLPRQERRLRERKAKPIYTFSTIQVDPGRTVTKGKSGFSESMGIQPLHIVRGNYAVYTEDRPMLGHTVGLVWRKAHVKGNPERGNRTHNYQIETPKGELAG